MVEDVSRGRPEVIPGPCSCLHGLPDSFSCCYLLGSLTFHDSSHFSVFDLLQATGRRASSIPCGLTGGSSRQGIIALCKELFVRLVKLESC
jgi:hypothetical protein